MTPEQYERWKDFSLRMVNIAVSARKKKPSRQDVRDNINFFFECRMDPDEEWRRVEDWDSTEDSQWHKDHRTHSMCVGDHISDLAEHFIPGYWSLPYEDEKPGVYEAAHDRYVGPVSACIRAGLDVAVAPSAGVAGFTAGDIRKMYPEGVPDWVKAFLGPGDVHDLAPTNIAGIYQPVNHRHDPRTFDELPDEEPVWL
jgi:hypothetical protein